MNKRSAVLIAAGLVLTLGIGGLAVSLGLTGPAAGASDLAGPQRGVEIQQRTVTAPPTGSDAAPVSLAADDPGGELHGEDRDEDEQESDEREEHDDHDDSEDEG